MTTSETGQVTGTADKDYNIIWYTEHCLDNTLRLGTFMELGERDLPPISSARRVSLGSVVAVAARQQSEPAGRLLAMGQPAPQRGEHDHGVAGYLAR